MGARSSAAARARASRIYTGGIAILAMHRTQR
jgi:hypothetical protein